MVISQFNSTLHLTVIVLLLANNLDFVIILYRENHVAQQPTVLFKRTRHHKGSIYCMSWTPDGSLIATGSNDKTVKLMKFNADTSNLEGQEIELAMHDGTVRDVCFIEDTSNRSSLLISGGAGDCKIYVTDCETGQPYQALSGHSGNHILSRTRWDSETSDFKIIDKNQ